MSSIHENEDINLPMWSVVYSIPYVTYDNHGNKKKLERRHNFHQAIHAETSDEARAIMQKWLDKDPDTDARIELVEEVKIINRIKL